MAKDTNIKLKSDGEMEWNFPEGQTIPRKDIYTILGQLEYSKTILLQMLHVPAEKVE